MDPDFDVDAGVATIAEGLNLGGEPEPIPSEVEGEDALGENAAPAPDAGAAGTAAAPVVRPPPKSWSKEYHEQWGKIDPKVQEYVELREKQMLDGLEQYKGDSGLGKTLRDVINPYRPMIEAQGLDEAKAVGYLFNTYYRLNNGTPEQRAAAFNELGRNLGFVQPNPNAAPVDPAVKANEERLARIEQSLTREQQQRHQAYQQKVSNDVTSFADAKDEKGNALHPYFDEVADDTIAFINAGHPLDEAYKRAVFANPVTREKEVARLKTEHDKQLREKAKQGAIEARRASGTNVRSRDTNRAPTGLLGTMEDTMKATLTDIKSRTH